jgi:hypothetical protein
MADSRSDKPQETPLNCDRDAARWAREFNEVLYKNHGLYADEGWLIAWFANAMMCGEDTYRWKLEREGRIAPSHATSMSLADALNAAWIAKYGGDPVQDEAVLLKRLKMLLSALECAETNFRVTNKAYCELDAKLRAITPSASGTREDGLREAAAYCRDLSDMVYRQGHANNLAAAQEEMARELERRADNAATESRAKE